jgi:hypothetical protein
MAVSLPARLSRGLCCSALAALVTCVPPARPEATPPQNDGWRHVPIGLCEDYPEESRSLAGVQRDLELLEKIGVNTLRVSLGWDGIEPQKDQYDLAFWDAFVELATARGVTLIPYVAYTPAWNSTGSSEDSWKAPPRDTAELGELLALLAGRYRGRIKSWEIWNEPDNKDYWTGSVAEYAELLRVGSAAVRGVDPALSVVAGGLAGRVEFLTELFDDFDAAALVNVVNLHSYYETWNPEPLETIPEYVAQVAALLERHGGRQDVWMAEVGYSDYREGSRVSDYTSSRYSYEHTLDYQAVVLVRTLALSMASPAISLVAWYELKDPPATDAMIGDVNNRHLGVVFNDYEPKPALAALGFMNRLFAGGFRVVDDRLRVEHPGATGDVHAARQAHAFLTPEQTLVVIAWLGTPGRGSQSAERASGQAEDERHEIWRIRAPFSPMGEATFHGARGDERKRVPAAPGARETELTLELRGGDVQVITLPVALD